MKIYHILLCLFLAVSTPAFAENDVWFSAGGISHHQQKGLHDNERNLGIGFQAGVTDSVRFVAQGFRNTHRIDSTMIGLAWSPFDLYKNQYVRIRPAIMAGSLTGYDLDAQFIAMPVLSFEGQKGWWWGNHPLGMDYVLAKEFAGSGGLVHILNFKVRF